jgi:hypothetical protein
VYIHWMVNKRCIKWIQKYTNGMNKRCIYVYISHAMTQEVRGWPHYGGLGATQIYLGLTFVYCFSVYLILFQLCRIHSVEGRDGK